MITCPWCGTHYAEFQPNCRNCGGALPLPAEGAPGSATADLRVPPPAPRNLPRNYAWRILATDAEAIVAGIFALLGAIFASLGLVFSLFKATSLVGLPFLGLGLIFLAVGAPLFVRRVKAAQRTIRVLREGQASLGQIVSVSQNFHVQVNGRHPWTIAYRFEAAGREYEGKVSTLSQPDLSQQPGKPVYVLYAPQDPQQNALYPHPYGYYGL